MDGFTSFGGGSEKLACTGGVSIQNRSKKAAGHLSRSAWGSTRRIDEGFTRLSHVSVLCACVRFFCSTDLEIWGTRESMAYGWR